MSHSALFLFAPKFKEMGADLASHWAANTGALQIHGACTGSKDVPAAVSKRLGDLCGEMHFLPDMEQKWAQTLATPQQLVEFDQRYPTGTFGYAITSDRRVGRAYVNDGLARPDLLGDAMLADPMNAPRNYVINLFAFVEELIERIQPAMVFCYAVAGAPAFAMSVVAARRGLKFYSLNPTRVGKRYVVDEGRHTFLQPVARRFREEGAISDAAIEEARTILHNFRNQPDAPDYHNFAKLQRQNRSANKEFLKLAKSSFKSGIGGYLGNRPAKQERARRKMFEAQALLRQKQAMDFPTKGLEDLTEPFVYFPLHVSPEASTMVLSPALTDQYAVVETLSKSIPAYTRLVVKDHWVMLGKRPDGFYERLARLPNVVMVDPFVRGLDLLQKAALTTVITGTAAWEAFLLGKPALVLADAQHRCVGAGTTFQSDLTKLPDAIKEAIAAPAASDDDILRYLGALVEESFELPTDVFWGDYLGSEESIRKKTVGLVGDAIVRRYQN